MKLFAIILAAALLCLVMIFKTGARAVTVIACYEYQSLIEVAKSQQGEIPVGTGRGPTGSLTFLLDPKDMSWGIITKADNGCSIYFGGTDFKFAETPPLPSKAM